MELTEELLREKEVEVFRFDMPKTDRLHSLFYSLQSMFWLSHHLAGRYGVDSVNVPAVEKFKKDLG
jgi:hypothetical protein